ncbi:hypothetical protein BH09ACT5_BH09ACT5_22100 [soil metagenome]
MSETANSQNEHGSQEHGHNTATPGEKVDGIVEQMRGDVAQGNVSDIRDALRQRLADAQIALDEAEFEEVLAAVGGSSS